MKYFKSYRESILIKDHIKCRHIIAGDYSYYAGYYHDKPFEDCVMYLDEQDNQREDHEIDRLIIGKYCSIATGAKFMMGGTQGHNYHWISTYPLDCFDSDFDNYLSNSPKGHKLKGDTIIGNDVWIGAEAMIMPGIKIGNGAIVAARSVVTKNIQDYEIWGGNPAQLIKKRFTDKEIVQLLQLKWWDWDIKTIKQNIDLLRSEDINLLWKKFQEDQINRDN